MRSSVLFGSSSRGSSINLPVRNGRLVLSAAVSFVFVRWIARSETGVEQVPAAKCAYDRCAKRLCCRDGRSVFAALCVAVALFRVPGIPEEQKANRDEQKTQHKARSFGFRGLRDAHAIDDAERSVSATPRQ